MKKLLIIFILIAGVFSLNIYTKAAPPKPEHMENNSNACDPVYEKVTDDARICAALDIMKGTVGEFSRNAILGNNLSEKPIKIEFMELSSLKPQYASYDALGLKKKKQLYIYINQKHQNAPAEALAALLSHEALHQDEYNSINEETYAWTMEAVVWSDLCKKNPSAKNDKISSLVRRENILLKMLENANYSNILIKNTVINHQGYKTLPTKSPGFDN